MSTGSPPRVSFLLPVHNHARTIRATMESLLSQTFSDFEVVVIDDASTDGAREILREFRDERIRVHRNEANLELTRSLNVGLELVRGEYVARIDADDLCLPTRIQQQVALLDSRPEIGVVGSFIETFSEDGSLRRMVSYPTEPAATAAVLLFRSPLAHPAVMLRRAALRRYDLRYDPAFRRGQDYDLWARCVVAGVQMANVPEVLLRYRVHAGQISRKDAGGVLETGAVVRKRLFGHMRLQASGEELAIHERLSWDQLLTDPAWLASAAEWLEKVMRANEKCGLFERDALGRVLCGRWVQVLRRMKQAGIPMPVEQSPLARYLNPEALES